MKYYLDCEFNGLGGELMTLALVREDGLYGYWLLPWSSELDPWVADHVVPIINSSPIRAVPSTSIGGRLQSFLKGDGDPIIVADWPDDIKYFCDCLITGPGTMIDVPGVKFEVHRVDAYPNDLPNAVQHNALWDALSLRYKLTGRGPT